MGVSPPVPYPRYYKLRYWFEAVDPLGNVIRAELYKLTGLDNSTEAVQIEYSESPIFFDAPVVDNILTAVKGSSIELNLIATLAEPLSDLYTEDEAGILLRVYKASLLFWQGFVIPDDSVESFVESAWPVKIGAVDCLALLENMAFIDQTTRAFFVGKMTEKDVIIKCLQRTRLPDIFVNFSVNIFYEGLNGDGDINAMDYVKVNTERYYTENSTQPMNCFEVLTSILERYNACISQRNGEYFIYRYNELFFNQNVVFKRYTMSGARLANNPVNMLVNLGSHINGALPHHSNENQLIYREKAYKKLTVNYKYGLLASLNTNSDLQDWTGGTPTGFILFGGISVSKVDDGLRFNNDSDDHTKSLGFQFSAVQGDSLAWTITIRLEEDSNVFTHYFEFTATINNTSWRLVKENDVFVWSNSNGTINRLSAFFVGNVYTISIDLPPLPVSGVVLFEAFGHQSVPSVLTKFGVTASDANLKDNKGELHTVTQNNDYSYIPDNKVIYNGDGASTVYVGTLYKTDGVTPTTKWFRKGVTESRPILEIMAEDNLIMFQKQRKKFTGDFYGWIDFLSIIKIATIDGFFGVASLQLDVVGNTGSLVLKEIVGDEIYILDYEVTQDTGAAIKPVIK